MITAVWAVTRVWARGPRTQTRVSSREARRTQGLSLATDLPPWSLESSDGDLLAVSTQRLDTERRPTGARKGAARLIEVTSSQQRLSPEVWGRRMVTRPMVYRRPGARPSRGMHTAGLERRRGPRSLSWSLGLEVRRMIRDSIRRKLRPDRWRT